MRTILFVSTNFKIINAMKKGKKIPRLKSHFRARSRGWKTRNIISLFLSGIICYALSKRLKLSIRNHGDFPSINLKRNEIGRTRVYQEKHDLSDNMNAIENYVIRPPKIIVEDKKDGIIEEIKTEKFKTIKNIDMKQKSAKEKVENFSSLEDTRPPIILVWKAMEYQMRNYKKHLEYFSPNECGGCQVTTNRSLVRECSALVHFNAPDLQKYMDVPDPKTRNPDQIYAFWSRETPSKTYKFRKTLQDPRFDPIFNLTMNFRVDADIIDYFGNIEYELRFFQTKNRDGIWLKKIMKRKNGLAIWAVSNCNSTYGATERMKYAKSLIEAGLNLTTYGDCFNNRYQSRTMTQEIMRHRFYLSFENSVHCPDYVSEKFWRNGFRGGAVPIVWGPRREDVAKQAPPHSYIHTEDFETPEKLVKYLNYLNTNDTAYKEYHSWRFRPVDNTISEYDIEPNHKSTLCRLCKKIFEKPRIHKTIPSVYKWLYETRYSDDLCFK
ncbi:3-galactosyl-N-acetylglucosaminide 4-alpha-L-fucosyltransferase FUT3-like isoform X1 [Styela clava]